MSAPEVVAKAGLVALRVARNRRRNRIPMLEAPPLARRSIAMRISARRNPRPAYAAVAEVLAWVWQLKRWRLAGGQPPKKPDNLRCQSI
ncbi:EscU/YscU/HrcU family type III secretion system export apparatus switch protein [Shigella flexneri]